MSALLSHEVAQPRHMECLALERPVMLELDDRKSTVSSLNKTADIELCPEYCRPLAFKAGGPWHGSVEGVEKELI